MKHSIDKCIKHCWWKKATYNSYQTYPCFLVWCFLCQTRGKQGTQCTVWCTIATNHLLFSFYYCYTTLFFHCFVFFSSSLVKSCMWVRLVLNCLISWLYIVDCFPRLMSWDSIYVCECINEPTFRSYNREPLIDCVLYPVCT